MSIKRKYPVGIQSFETIRKDGYLYVDKTPLVYKMITEGVPYFLSRPRRFGKSLLISTLQAVFEGRRDLVLFMPKGIYVIELKYNDTADVALAQIEAKDYAEKYRLDDRPVTKVGIAFSSEERNITEWKSIAQ